MKTNTYKAGGRAVPSWSPDERWNRSMKNPWMSLWLSGANSVMNSARMRTTAQIKRQQSELLRASTKQVASFWTAALTLPTGKSPKTRQRARRK